LALNGGLIHTPLSERRKARPSRRAFSLARMHWRLLLFAPDLLDLCFF